MRSRNVQNLFITLCAFSAFTVAVYLYNTAYTSSTYRKNNIGYIWPTTDGIETSDRLVNQISLIDKFWPKDKTGNTSKPLPLRPDQMKVILIHGQGAGWARYREGQSFFIAENCPINSCTITGNMSMRLTAHALLMYNFNLTSPVKLLPKPPHQIWMTFHSESSVRMPMKSYALKDLINWTSTYRRESTLPFPYAHLVPVFNSTPITGVNYASGKTGKAAWLVSNCHPSNDRISYASELSRYIDVDVYGYCGTKKCPMNESCRIMIGRQYKFYLAFENSNCKDYITEKFFHNNLDHNILPIALGANREDYIAAAPPMSYILVDDFRTPRELAAYLHHLDKNDTAYNEYFKWKGTVVNVMRFGGMHWCRLCTLLHLQERDDYVHWYDDYAAWWNDAGDPGSIQLLSTNLQFSTYSSAFIFSLMVSLLFRI